MRLASCIALEVATGLILMGGVASSVVWGVTELGGETHESEARVQPESAETAVAAVQPEPVADPEAGRDGGAVPPADAPPAQPADEGDSFAGQPDEALLAPIRTGAIARVKIGSCCTSLNMRIDFDNGARAAFKPNQRNLGSMPRKEIAAYRMDRLLGLNAVPPALGRRFRVGELIAAIRGGEAADRQRVDTEMVTQDGTVDGELTWWIPALSKPKLGGKLIDTAEGVALWQRHLTIGNEIPEQDRALLAQISEVLLFDFLINNIDRWSGGNVRASEDGATLFFMDNTMAFRPQPRGHGKVNAYLRRAQKFPRSLVAAMRGLTAESVREAMNRELGPFQYLLTDTEIDALLARRDAALVYVDRLIARAGEDAVLVFP